ncbi:TonB-dependent receptor [Sphingomonas sp. MMS24-J13]|uniref:TonB-dependent receptor n=1 Tax=Sphingomonas sp. MMS24-J13 TaxID=3238686 RepID=UPI00385010C2
MIRRATLPALLGGTVLSLAWPTAATAQAAPDQTITADGEITVTAARLGAGKGRATFELDRSDIQDRPLGADITQSLAKVPGVKVSSGDLRGGSFSFEIFLRGLNKEQIGFTLDGIPTGDARFNGGSPPQRFIEPSNIGTILVSQSAGDIGAPSRFALGGFIDFRSDDPAKKFGVTVEGGAGSDDFLREYVRIDTGELEHGLTSYASFSHQRNDIWAGPNGRHDSRSHAEWKLAKQFDSGSFLKARVVYNRQFDNDFNIVTLPQFRANEHGDGLNDTLTGIPNTDLLYGGTFGGKRKDFLAYVNGGLVLGDHVTLTANPYYQTLDGYSLSYQNRHRQLTGGDPYAVIGYAANGGAIRPALTTITAGNNLYGGPADMRVTPRDRERYGTTAELKIADLIPRNTLRAGIWYEGGTSHEERDFYAIIPSTTSIEWQVGKPSYVQYLRQTSITTFEAYAQDSIAIIPDKLRIDAGLTWYRIHYTAKSPLEYSAHLSFAQHSPVQPKVSISYKPIDHVELFGGYARNFSGISEDAFLGSTAVIQPGDLKPLTSENFDGGIRYTKGPYALSLQAFHVHLKNGVGIVPNDPTVTDPIDIQRGNVATRAASIKGQRTTGVELTGMASFRWIDLYATYSYQEAKYDDAAIGSRDRLNLDSVAIIPGTGVRDIPKHSAYGEVTLKPTADLRFQANVRYISSRVGADIVAPTTFQEIGIERIPGYTLVGLSARYRVGWLPLKSAFVQINVDNLFDRGYIGSVSSATATAAETGLPGRSLGRYFVGAPRTVTGSFQIKF